MKKVFLIVVAVVFTVASYAQTSSTTKPVLINPTASHSGSAAVSMVKYYCTKCDYSDTKAGVCPTHKGNLVKVGDYYCATDGIAGVKGRKCGKCGKPFISMTDKAKRDEMMRSAKIQQATPSK